MSKAYKRVVMLGPQGSGKSTQAEVIADFLKLNILSSGDILRAEMEQKTILGNKIAQLVNSGQLIPDDDITEIVLHALKAEKFQSGFLLDGFPRNIHQAETLDKYYNIDKVINIEVSDAEAIQRISGRLICSQGHVFHTDHRPASRFGRCDICHKPLYSRTDDQAEIVAKRLAIYRRQTSQLLSYYTHQNKLLIFDGAGSIAEVSQSILSFLQADD